MTIVLGADAAVNGRLPDGVLLISFAAGHWHLIYEGSSYRRLLDHTEEGFASASQPVGLVAEAKALLFRIFLGRFPIPTLR